MKNLRAIKHIYRFSTNPINSIWIDDCTPILRYLAQKIFNSHNRSYQLKFRDVHPTATVMGLMRQVHQKLGINPFF
ncbi:hypothetical protein Xen7305DRAFT_00000180 [Xenococcus sp. PCC 7305]|nr:hypothetical protein Xen7305DRAFT_00000180 [Xenococcus sp. PCC 7305]